MYISTLRAERRTKTSSRGEGPRSGRATALPASPCAPPRTASAVCFTVPCQLIGLQSGTVLAVCSTVGLVQLFA